MFALVTPAPQIPHLCIVIGAKGHAHPILFVCFVLFCLFCFFLITDAAVTPTCLAGEVYDGTACGHCPPGSYCLGGNGTAAVAVGVGCTCS